MARYLRSAPASAAETASCAAFGSGHRAGLTIQIVATHSPPWGERAGGKRSSAVGRATRA
jgi:hypothetical protein